VHAGAGKTRNGMEYEGDRGRDGAGRGEASEEAVVVVVVN